MGVRIALLRGVNVGRAHRVGMAEVRQALDTMGYGPARSLLQSGNLVFDAGERSDSALEAAIETGLAAQLGLKTEVVVRQPAAWAAMIDANPFQAEATVDPSHLIAHVMKTPPKHDAEAALNALAKSGERARVIGREAFIVYPAGIADSALTGAALDRALGSRGTARNWNTVLKLAALAG